MLTFPPYQLIPKSALLCIWMKKRRRCGSILLMKKEDYLLRGYSANGEVRFFAISCPTLVEEARLIHHLYPVATVSLGRALSAALLVSETLKGEETLTLRFKGEGPLKEVMAVVDAKGGAKGYVQVPDGAYIDENGHYDVGKSLGKGELTVIRDMHLKEPYISSIPLYNGEIGEDLTHYFAESEQTPTSISLGVKLNEDGSVKASGGFFVQLLPGAKEETIAKLERNIAAIGSVTALLEAGKSPEDIIDALAVGFEPVFTFEPRKVFYSCNCSKERYEKILLTLGRKELRDILKEGKPIECKCEFCGKTYTYSLSEIENLYYSLFTTKGKA